MSFTSLTYLLFLPLVFAAYWATRRQLLRNAVLVVASYFFYAWWDWRFCGLMLGSSLIDYVAAIGIEGSASKGRRLQVFLDCLVAAHQEEAMSRTYL